MPCPLSLYINLCYPSFVFPSNLLNIFIMVIRLFNEKKARNVLLKV
ncbi:hypothetical protein YPPY13_0834 [Yersinia pestis PY-13]|nr:hypothetical protein YpB42003004_4400 [Yersinia pestis biovar Antiqua str. B42003004]EDR59400.1 hypothetical protein YpMG051020_1884 [Yersinia pestis biovar Orientalis str. MG05-1020]EDR65676.1 hypothetical protein YpK1973002_0632 [Yersinia pestis biovar Mediaevalis str. K1973002]EFA47029.1 conserved hypothetical protein [Yersinia pestis KIM D27]EIQ93320.1 hypothetical protein YPPY01_0756 [Yersinia pestis PY-01]EIQ96469.1 hypothetical protein YPPY03_0818 [Yersinia pestis PY-03]EIR07570.1 h